MPYGNHWKRKLGTTQKGMQKTKGESTSMSNTVNKELLSNFINYVILSPEEKLQYKQLVGKVKCPFCGKEFESEEDAYEHIREKHNEDPEEIKIE